MSGRDPPPPRTKAAVGKDVYAGYTQNRFDRAINSYCREGEYLWAMRVESGCPNPLNLFLIAFIYDYEIGSQHYYTLVVLLPIYQSQDTTLARAPGEG
jgi:hypothetical protein